MHALLIQISLLQVVGGAMYLIRTKLLALVLGTEGYGIVSVIDQFVQLTMQASTLAIPFAATKILAAAYGRNRSEFQSAYTDLLRLLLSLGAIGAVAGIVLIGSMPGLLGPALASRSHITMFALTALPAIILHGFFRSVSAASQDPRGSALGDVLTAAAMTAAISIAVLIFGFRGYFVGTLVGGVIVSAAYHLYLSRRLGVKLLRAGQGIASFLGNSRSFIYLALASYVAVFMAPLALMVMRAATFNALGAEAAGLLQSALGISFALNLVLNPLQGLLMLPRVSQSALMEEKFREARYFRGKILLATFVVSLPLCLFPDVAIAVLFSTRFLEMAPMLAWFIVGQALTQVAWINLTMLVGLDRPSLYALCMAGATLLGITTTVLLVPRIGLAGAGIATCSSATALLVSSALLLRGSCDLRFDPRQDGAAITLLILLFVCGFGLGRHASTDVPVFLLKSSVLVCSLALAIALTLESSERRAMIERVENAFGRLRS